MLNKEKYAKEIINFACYGAFGVKNNRPVSCDSIPCEDCDLYSYNDLCEDARAKWLNSEYVEPEQLVDWYGVSVNTPILVRHNDNDEWHKRYFCKYDDGKIYAWDNGMTSWTTGSYYMWNQAKLVKGVKVPELSEIDWTKVAVDTPIIVRDYDNEDWQRRYFCKYENGRIYAWNGGRTSWTTKSERKWNHARLA